MEPIKDYLGDGVYAEYDGYQIWLRTERNGTTESIALEQKVYGALKKFASRLGWNHESKR